MTPKILTSCYLKGRITMQMRGVTMRDLRCAIVNVDPHSASSAPEVLKAVVRVNQNNAGIYGTVTGTGQVAVGPIVLLRAAKGNIDAC